MDVSSSSAVKWLQRWQETGSVAAKPTGGSISPLEERADWLLALIAKQPDLTLNEIVVAMRKRRISGSRSAVWRLFARHGISFKKKPARSGARATNLPKERGLRDRRPTVHFSASTLPQIRQRHSPPLSHSTSSTL
jgi:transposase